MANSIELGGKKYDLKFTRFSAFSIAEQTGQSFKEFLRRWLIENDNDYAGPLVIWACTVWKYSVDFQDIARVLNPDIRKELEAATTAFFEYYDQIKQLTADTLGTTNAESEKSEIKQ